MPVIVGQQNKGLSDLTIFDKEEYETRISGVAGMIKQAVAQIPWEAFLSTPMQIPVAGEYLRTMATLQKYHDLLRDLEATAGPQEKAKIKAVLEPSAPRLVLPGR